MPKKIIIFPFGGNARESLISILEINKIRKEWDILGFIDDDRSLWGRVCCDVEVKGGRQLLKKNPDTFILAVPGNANNYLKRKEIIASLSLENSRYTTIISPGASIAPDAKIGYNTLIMSGVVVSCGVKIGDHCVILPNTVVAHDTVIGNYCCIGSGTSISGNVRICSECYIGSGVNIKENIHIGEKTLIGIGADVISDIKEKVVAVGNPARVIRKAVI